MTNLHALRNLIALLTSVRSRLFVLRDGLALRVSLGLILDSLK